MPLSTHSPNTQALHDAILSEIPSLRRFARFLMRAPDIADDLVQDTLTRAVAAAASFQPGTNVRAWLFTILKNATRNHARSLRRNPVDQVDTLDLTVPSTNFASPLERLEFAELVAAIDLLPETFRQVVLLCGVEGFPVPRGSPDIGRADRDDPFAPVTRPTPFANCPRRQDRGRRVKVGRYSPTVANGSPGIASSRSALTQKTGAARAPAPSSQRQSMRLRNLPAGGRT